MSQSEMDRQIQELLKTADEAQHKNDIVAQSNALRRAFQLRPDNEEVRKRWHALQTLNHNDGGAGAAFPALQAYISSGKVEDGRKAVETISRSQLPEDQAASVLNLIERANAEKLPLLDAITAGALDRQLHIQCLVAERFAANNTKVFQQMFQRGDETFRAFCNIPGKASVWEGKPQHLQTTAKRDIFQLCVATLMDAGVEHPERAMKAVARQVATAPQPIIDFIDEDVFDVVLSSLDIRKEQNLRSQALLAASSILELTKDKGEELFATFITGHVSKQTNEDLVIAFSAAAAVFPIVPVVASKLFMTDGFVQQLVPLLEQNSDPASAGGRKSYKLERSALELLSAACIDKACREAIKRYCSPWLRNLSNEREGTHTALAALVLAKIDEGSGDDVTARLASLILEAGDDGDQAIEGLAYTSLKPKIKEEIASNSNLVNHLVTALKERPTTSFGCLTVFSNISSYRRLQSEEQKKMAQLKAYANSAKPAPEDPLDDDQHVNARCKTLLDANVVPALVSCCKQMSSPTNVALVVRVLLALAKEQKHRPKMAQQGAVKLSLQIRERIAKTDKATNEAALIERTSAHVLARLLISVNPAHIFSASLPISSAVSALLPLLSQDQEDNQDERDLLPTFEALLALTNLASMEDSTARDMIIRSTASWDRIEDLLFSSNTLIQRASAELVCNLMASPACVAKFAIAGDGPSSKDAKRRMQILLALADVEDVATRRAAGGALAMLTEWDVPVSSVLDAKEGKGIQVVLAMCGDENDEVKHRGLVCLANVLNAPGEVGKRGLKEVKDVGGANVVREALKGTRSAELLGIGVEILKQLG